MNDKTTKRGRKTAGMSSRGSRKRQGNQQKSSAQSSPLGKLTALIERHELRLDQLLVRERESGEYIPEARHSIELLQKMYVALLKIQQELGLQPAYLRGPRPKDAPSDGVFRHSMYSFLDSDEAQLLSRIEKQASRGEIGVVELYRLTADLIRAGNERAARTGTPP